MESVILFFLTRMLSCKEGLQSPVSYTYASKASPGEGRYSLICFSQHLQPFKVFTCTQDMSSALASPGMIGRICDPLDIGTPKNTFGHCGMVRIHYIGAG